ncbi:erythromycin resistance leader peptide [Ureibacillus sp. Re31]|uniref:Erythromycin resistance leader peptide n=1 Tax=Ureibacillus galli TaxID=2762222 RepID=A0ABR8XDZ7_9BACL|nr:erythromycin resistance leader peptide [Ureibacillus galli]
MTHSMRLRFLSLNK